MTTSKTRAAALCALLATTCLITPAIAQTAGTPSIHKNVDENGVDLTDGSFNFGLVEGSMGAGEGAIALMRFHGLGGQRDNLSVEFNRTVSGGTASITLTFGNRTETFTGASGATNFSSAQGNGATLTKVSASTYNYTAAEGSVTNYGPPPGLTNASNNGFCSATNESACGLIAIQTTEPNGADTTYQWDVGENCTITGYDQWGEPIESCAQFWRQRGMSNNFGYRVRFTFEQEADPTSGLPNSSWHKRTGATLHNDSVTSTARTVGYVFPSSTVTDVTTDGGRTWRFTRDSQQRIIAIRRPGSASDNVSITYTAPTSLVVSQVITDGVATNYARTVAGMTGTMVATDPLGHQRTVVSDLGQGRPTAFTDELGRSTSFLYDANARPTAIFAPEGNSIQYSYDARGNVVTTTALAKGSTLPAIATSAGFDETCVNVKTCNQPNWTKDAAGNQTDFAYDSATGQLLTVTAPAPSAGAVRPQTRYGYASVSGVSMLSNVSACQTQNSCAGAADEVNTSIIYGANRLPASVSSGAGDGSLTTTQAMSYTAAGDVETIDGPLSGPADTVRTRYNAAREAIGQVSSDPDGSGPLQHRAVRTTYDAEGKVTAQELGTVTDQGDAAWAAFASLETVNVAYDSNGRAVKQTLSAGGTIHAATETSYDVKSRPECTAQRMNPANFGALTNACTLTAEGTFGPDRISKTVYDAADQVIAFQVAVGTADAATETSGTYTPNGKLATLTDAENNRTTYEYDAHDRPSKTLYPVPAQGTNASSTTDYEQLGYDSRSNVVSQRLRDGQSIDYGYDGLSRLIVKDLPGAEPDVAYGYDLAGRIISASQPGRTFSFSYDALGRQLGETTPLGTIGSAYDLVGNRTRITHPDGFFVDQDYLVTGELKAIRENGATSGVGMLATFAYDDLGRRTSLTRGNGTVTSYAFDPVSRLAQMSLDIGGTAYDLTLGFSYNPAGQIVSNTRSNDAYAWRGHGSGTTNATANGLNQLNQVGGASLSHDARGNLTSDGVMGFTYSSENQLTGQTVGAGAASYLRNAAFEYDPLGRLYRNISGSSSSTWLHDAGNLIVEYLPSGQLNRRHIFGPGGEIIVTLPYVGGALHGRYWLHGDERGSAIASSKADGSLDGGAPTTYDEYGWSGGAFNIFGFTGERWLPWTDLIYLRNRIYDPKKGRFLQSDPISYWGGMNLYAYVENDPVNFTDPSGLIACDDPTRCLPDGTLVVTGDRGTRYRGGSSLGGGGGSREAADAARLNRIERAQLRAEACANDPKYCKPQKEKSTVEKLKNCAAAQYGFGDGETPTGIDLAKIGSEIGSLPVFKPLAGIPIIGDSSRFTNVLNYTSFKLGLNARFEGAGLRSLSKAAFGSVRIATVLGRANVIVGGALLAIDAASIAVCTARD